MKKNFRVNGAARIIAMLLLVATVITVIPAFDFTVYSAGDAKKASGDLPIIYLTTDDGKIVDDRANYKHANMSIKLNEEFADCENQYTTDDGSGINIRCRGNSTFTFGNLPQVKKYAYRIKLDKKADMFGMGESKHWILLANYFEPTFLRNKAGYELSRALGLWYCDSTWVEVYLNGEYRGLYQFCESVRVDENRADIFDWDETIEDIAAAIGRGNGFTEEKVAALEDALETNLDWATSYKVTYNRKQYDISKYYDVSKIKIDSGYIIEYDSFDNNTDTRPPLFDTSNGNTPKGVELRIDTPEYAYTNSTMLKFVRELIVDFENAVYSPTFYNDKGKHYSEYVDMDSMVNFWIQQQLYGNGEFGIRSMFFCIEDGKIVWSPVWDLDCGGGNHITVSTNPGAFVGEGNRNHWYHELYGDPYFVVLLQERWKEIEEAVDDYYNAIPGYREYIKDAVDNDFAKYGKVHGWGQDKYEPSKEYSEFHKYVADRIEWFGNLMSTQGLKLGSTGFVKSEKVTMNLQYAKDSKALGKDKETLYGLVGDFVYDTTVGGDVNVIYSTLHTSVIKVDMYVNGVKAGSYKADDDNPSYTLTIPAKYFDTTEGAMNVIYAVAYNREGNLYQAACSYTTMLTSSKGEVGTGEFVVRCGDYYLIAKRKTTITLPMVTGYADGLTISGFDINGTVYKPGSEYIITESVKITPVWERNEKFAVLTVEDTEKTEYRFAKADGFKNVYGKDVAYIEDEVLTHTPAVSFAGVQDKTENGKTTLRLVGTVDKDANSVGFVVSIGGESKEYVTNYVYEKVYSEMNAYVTENAYIYTAELDIESSGEVKITVTPFVLKDGIRTDGTATEITYKNGSFAG